jgi:hypothetical protein
MKAYFISLPGQSIECEIDETKTDIYEYIIENNIKMDDILVIYDVAAKKKIKKETLIPKFEEGDIVTVESADLMLKGIPQYIIHNGRTVSFIGVFNVQYFGNLDIVDYSNNFKTFYVGVDFIGAAGVIVPHKLLKKVGTLGRTHPIIQILNNDMPNARIIDMLEMIDNANINKNGTKSSKKKK